MLKKRFYDILTIVYIILIVAVFLTGYTMYYNTFVDKALSGESNIFTPIYISNLIVLVLAFIYWIIILVLAIRLHREELTKTIDLAVIAIIIPLAPIFYLANLRKSLKKYHER